MMPDCKNDDIPECRGQCFRRTVILFAVVATLLFLSGYLTSTLFHRDRVYQEGQRQFMEFLSIAADLEIITIHGPPPIFQKTPVSQNDKVNMKKMSMP